MLNNNKEVYKTVEFDAWAYREGLSYEEKYLIEHYLKKHLKTIEAGTAGGRIILAMKEMGFLSLYGYDYVPEFIAQAKKKEPSGSISFEVEDATSLSYKNCAFDQILYLQQIISSIDGEDQKLKALQEAYRILKKDGIALFSFLCFETRVKNPFYILYIAYLSIFRKLFRINRSVQYLPWLKLGGKMNFSSLIDRGPYIYWYKPKEVYQLLKDVGFRIVALGSSYQISQGNISPDIESLLNQKITGGLYFVCTK